MEKKVIAMILFVAALVICAACFCSCGIHNQLFMQRGYYVHNKFIPDSGAKWVPYDTTVHGVYRVVNLTVRDKR